jgi:hypothetical protein
MPVYNDKHNRHNPRRIHAVKAQHQRWARDANGVRKWVPRVIRLATYLAILAIALSVGVDRMIA